MRICGENICGAYETKLKTCLHLVANDDHCTFKTNCTYSEGNCFYLLMHQTCLHRKSVTIYSKTISVARDWYPVNNPNWITCGLF